MKIKPTSKKEKIEALKIAEDLKEWFTKEGIKNMKTDFKFNQVVVAFDKKILGFLCYTTNCGRMQILWIGVKREFHKKGIGTKLLEWLEKEARKYGLYAIEVETLSDKEYYEPYKRTREFFYKKGFKKILYKRATKKGYDEQIVLLKSLKPFGKV